MKMNLTIQPDFVLETISSFLSPTDYVNFSKVSKRTYTYFTKNYKRYVEINLSILLKQRVPPGQVRDEYICSYLSLMEEKIEKKITKYSQSLIDYKKCVEVHSRLEDWRDSFIVKRSQIEAYVNEYVGMKSLKISSLDDKIESLERCSKAINRCIRDVRVLCGDCENCLNEGDLKSTIRYINKMREYEAVFMARYNEALYICREIVKTREDIRKFFSKVAIDPSEWEEEDVIAFPNYFYDEEEVAKNQALAKLEDDDYSFIDKNREDLTSKFLGMIDVGMPLEKLQKIVDNLSPENFFALKRKVRTSFMKIFLENCDEIWEGDVSHFISDFTETKAINITLFYGSKIKPSYMTNNYVRELKKKWGREKFTYADVKSKCTGVENWAFFCLLMNGWESYTQALRENTKFFRCIKRNYISFCSMAYKLGRYDLISLLVEERSNLFSDIEKALKISLANKLKKEFRESEGGRRAKLPQEVKNPKFSLTELLEKTKN